MKTNSFVVYNASAGSGKTFTLVKSYLAALFKSSRKDKFKHILAITFTNKAVAEMKERVLDNLEAFANPKILIESTPLFQLLVEELIITPQELHKRAVTVRDALLNNYAAFDVVTIDTFTHRIIRTFAYDLKLPQNFEVALDTEEVLHEAVQNLVKKVGQDEQLTKLLIEFALQKTDDDKSWDISLDLFKVARLLLNENENSHLNKIANKRFKDFDLLKEKLTDQITQAEKQITQIAQSRVTAIENEGIDPKDFVRGLYSFFLNFSKAIPKVEFDKAWQNKLLSGEPLYPKRVNAEIAAAIDAMQVEMSREFQQIKEQYNKYAFLKNFLKNLVPLSVLNTIHQEVEQLKEEQQIILISEFNEIISKEIKDQPAPFIYERIGERYENYFIDEFQDTSLMQWENLIPLTENALVSQPIEGEQHSLMLVGDAKQAIYRWRGGKPEQFIGLYEKDNPFYIEKEVANLDTNYRSYSEIIEFNNSLFTHMANIFANSSHQELYKIGNKQFLNDKRGGYVQLSFIDNVLGEEATLLYQEETLKIVQEALNLGFQKSEICVITRKKKEGVSIADFLVENDVPIVSSETLLLSKSPEVQFIVSFLYYVLYPDNKEHHLALLYYLYKKLNLLEEEHLFYANYLELAPQEFFTELSKAYNIIFDYSQVSVLPLYELVEEVIRAFVLVKESDAYVQYFLDEVLQFSQKRSTGIHGFLEEWENQKEQLSIVAPEGIDAVTIMTIHKSKGLEFPVVIFPFADIDIYRENEAKVWYPINSDEYFGFSEAYLSYSKDLTNYGEIGEVLYEERKQQLELDNINLLYVTLTRAKEHLYIISKKNVTKEGNEKMNYYSGFFINYLKQLELWEDSKIIYKFGEQQKLSAKVSSMSNPELHFVSSPRIAHNLAIITKSGFLWETEQEKAIEKGNLVHLILSKITYQRDLPLVFQEILSEGLIHKEQLEQLRSIVENVVLHSEIAYYFEEQFQVFNEREILTEEGKLLIPDRVVIIENEAIIIDYKTGVADLKYDDQINNYANAITQIGYKVTKKLIVYISEEIEVIEVF